MLGNAHIPLALTLIFRVHFIRSYSHTLLLLVHTGISANCHIAFIRKKLCKIFCEHSPHPHYYHEGIYILFNLHDLSSLSYLVAGFSDRRRSYPRDVTSGRVFKGLFLLNQNIAVKAVFSDHKQCYSLTKSYPFLAWYIITKTISGCQSTNLVYYTIETF